MNSETNPIVDTNLNQEKIDTNLNKEKVEENNTEETKQQVDWRIFREQRKIDRTKREEAESLAKKKQEEAQALREAMDVLLSKQNQPNNQNNQYSSTGFDEEDETEDQRIEKKVQIALAKRESEAEKLRKEQEHKDFPKRLVNNYPDFDNVCNTNNLDYLEFHYPEIAEAFKHVPDGYDKWSSVYKAVKRFVPSIDMKNDQAKSEKNMLKPQSMSNSNVSVNSGQGGGSAFRLDEARKAENYARMQKIMKGL